MAWLQAKEDIRKLIEEEFMHKKQKTRSKIARFNGELVTNVQPAAPVQIYSPPPPSAAQKPTQKIPQIPTAVPDDLSDPQLRPKKKFVSVQRERVPHLMEADQFESIPVSPTNE